MVDVYGDGGDVGDDDDGGNGSGGGEDVCDSGNV